MGQSWVDGRRHGLGRGQLIRGEMKKRMRRGDKLDRRGVRNNLKMVIRRNVDSVQRKGRGNRECEGEYQRRSYKV